MDEWPKSTPAERDEHAARNRMWTEIARQSLIHETWSVDVVESGSDRTIDVTRRGVGPITTHAGHDFFVFDLHVSDEWGKYLVVVQASLDGTLTPRFDPSCPVMVRIDSGCETGQVLHDVTCECREQMHAALDRIGSSQGLLISIPGQDGRGRGLPFKLATLTLQRELGLDTVRASAHMDPVGERDARTYAGAIAVLKALGVDTDLKLVVLSNNKGKLAVFAENGYDAMAEPLSVGQTDANRLHLEAKRDELGHTTLDPDS